MSKHIGEGGAHDVGGCNNCVPEQSSIDGKLDLKEKPMAQWEFCIHALLVVLACKTPAMITTDELRRCIEGLEPRLYREWGYYDKWSASISQNLIDRKVLTEAELLNEICGEEVSTTDPSNPKFAAGDRVQVRDECTRVRWRRPHIRSPGYIFGQTGTITEIVGEFEDPFLLAFRGKGRKQWLYRVAFSAQALWSSTSAGTTIPADEANGPGAHDVVFADVYEEWLNSTTNNGDTLDRYRSDASTADIQLNKRQRMGDGSGDSTGDGAVGDGTAGDVAVGSSGSSSDQLSHSHSHDHGHIHESRYAVESTAVDREGESTPPGRVIGEALLRLLYRKAVVTAAEINQTIERLQAADAKIAGAELVVKAWRDAAFKQRLVTNADAAAAEIGVITSNPNAPTVLKVVANSQNVHNVVVCTLCSCYPTAMLGFSPAWYKSRSYRARMVKQPRKVLAEFGTFLADDIAIYVHDSTADCRYLVLPLPPAQLMEPADGVDGASGRRLIDTLSDTDLLTYVTRDSMIGVRVL